jgi:hypothetical protein
MANAHQAAVHDILIRIDMALEHLLAEVRHVRVALAPDPAYDAPADDDQEPDVDDEPLPDYGPPGSGAVIVEYSGWEYGAFDGDVDPERG